LSNLIMGKNRSKTRQGSSAISQMVRVGTNIAKDVGVAVKKRYTGNKAVANIAKDLSMLKMLVNAEDKQIYTLATNQTVVQGTALVYGIGTVAQGNASNQRSGDSIRVNRIDLNLGFVYNSGTPATTAALDQTFNWYLVRYLKTPSSSGTTAFSIAEFLNQDANGNYTPLSFPNPDTAENFQLMANGQVHITLPAATTAISTVHKIVEISHPCSFHQEYNGSANSTITDNMCFLVFTAYNPINAGGASVVQVQSAMWYIDN